MLRRLLASKAQSDVCCHGVDLVREQPVWFAALPLAQRYRVAFTGGVSVAQLPFSDAKFDAVISQFGIEYADLQFAIPEALRVLRPGGLLGFLMHHEASRPANLARVELGQAQWLLSSGWLEAGSKMCDALSLTAHEAGRRELASSSAWAKVRQTYDGLTSELQAMAQRSACPDLFFDAQHWMSQAFRVSASQGVSAGRLAAQEVRGLIQDTQTRLNDMLGHVLSHEQISAVVAMIAADGGGPAQASLLDDRGHLLGWWVQRG